MGDQLPGGRQPETEGEKYLVELERAHLADDRMPTSRGTIPARDFLEVCGEHARPALKALVEMGPTDPRYKPAKEVLQGVVDKYIEGDQTGQ